jgi:hypothetical protein
MGERIPVVPVASRAPGMLAGIFGGSGSGSHPELVIVIILVVTAVIATVVVSIRHRTGGSYMRTVAAPVSTRTQGVDGARTTPDATLRLSRVWTGVFGSNEEWPIAIDGAVVGAVANNETVDVSVEPGAHTLRLGTGRHRSGERTFELAQDEVVGFQCHGPRMWPIWLAALVKSDLWISLRRD